MAGIIAKSCIEQIRAACDIADVLGSYLQLKRAGNSFKALCPFHKEKTPSFHVNPQRQIFHCFGCGAGGDVFKFVMQHENVDFSTAAKLLAQRASISIQYEAGGEDREEGAGKDALYRLHEQLATFYHKILTEHETGEAGRRYLQARALDGAIVTNFQLGFAPDRPDALRRWADAKQVDFDLLQTAGFVNRNEQDDGYYDRFRGRLMFPLRDEVGRVVGFSGRIIAKDQHPAKYVNSPETPIFRKSRLLFGLDRARRDILESRTALICEGQIDVIRCHGAGLTTAVAGLGTALTEEHARLLRRYADSVVLLLDADTAGQNSAMRSADIFTAAGLTARAAALPAGEDPDSLVLKQGPEALRALVQQAGTALDFQIDVLRARDPSSDPAALLRIARAVLESIAAAPSAVQQEQMARAAATRLNLSPDALLSDLRQRARRTTRPAAPAEESPPAPASHPVDEVELARVLFHHPECLELATRYLPLALITDPDCRHILQALRNGSTQLVADLAEAGEEAPRLAAAIMASDTRVIGHENTPAAACQDIILRIRRRALELRRRALTERRSQLSGAEFEAVDQELKQIIMDLHALKQGWARAQPVLDLGG